MDDPELGALKVLVDEFWTNAHPRQLKSLLARYPQDTSLFLTQDWQEYIEEIWRRSGKSAELRGQET